MMITGSDTFLKILQTAPLNKKKTKNPLKSVLVLIVFEHVT